MRMVRLLMERSTDRQVLECASPLALYGGPAAVESGRGLPHSKTLPRRSRPLADSWAVSRSEWDKGFRMTRVASKRASSRSVRAASVCRVHNPKTAAAGDDPVRSERALRDSLSPQRGEGRGEGCDQPRCSLAPRALLLLEAKKGGNAPASWPERRTANIELPTRNLRFASRPSFDSSPRPSPRSRRRGSAGGLLHRIRLPTALFSFRPISAKRAPAEGR